MRDLKRGKRQSENLGSRDVARHRAAFNGNASMAKCTSTQIGQ